MKKMMQKSMFALALLLLSTPVIFAQDLSKYRNFSLGMDLADVSKQVNGTPADARVVLPGAPLIQELTWWPEQSYPSPIPPQSVQDVLFSFYNGNLYKIAVTYESSATEGLTAEDMVRAVSAKYGAATVPAAATNPPIIAADSSAGETLAFWEDSQYSLTLSRSSLSDTFQLVVYSKQLNSKADAAIAEAMKQELDGAPQREIANVKKAADDLELTRQANLKAFRP
jgi:hypothetical protein